MVTMDVTSCPNDLRFEEAGQLCELARCFFLAC